MCFVAAHIVHNIIKTVVDWSPVDIKSIVVKIFSYFYTYTVRVQSFKELCVFINTEYKQILDYSKTRWLGLMPAIDRILQMYPGLKSYFLNQVKCLVLLKYFFNNSFSEA